MTRPLEIVRIADGSIEVEVVPAVGARLHRLRVDGHDLLRTPPELARHLDDPYFWGSYPMVPWCNRIAAGRTAVAGRELDLPATFPDGTAIHGQVSQAPWTQVGDTSFRIRAGSDGWPWPYEVTQDVSADGHAFGLELRVTNLADDPMPAGLGIHPWFRRPVRVAIAAASAYASHESTDPEPRPVTGRFDRRRLEALPDGLDTCWTDLAEPPIVLDWPQADVRATVEASSTVRYVVAASPGELDAVAVEPQTHAPAGIRRLLDGSAGGLTLLDPGETLTMTVRFAFGSTKPDTT
jgi:aldose 1-epimerase